MLPRRQLARLYPLFSTRTPTRMRVELTMQLMENAIKDSSVEMTTVNTEFALVRENGKWLIDFSDTSSRSFVKAVTGNLSQVFGE